MNVCECTDRRISGSARKILSSWWGLAVAYYLCEAETEVDIAWRQDAMSIKDNQLDRSNEIHTERARTNLITQAVLVTALRPNLCEVS